MIHEVNIALATSVVHIFFANLLYLFHIFLCFVLCFLSIISRYELLALRTSIVPRYFNCELPTSIAHFHCSARIAVKVVDSATVVRRDPSCNCTNNKIQPTPAGSEVVFSSFKISHSKCFYFSFLNEL